MVLGLALVAPFYTIAADKVVDVDNAHLDNSGLEETIELNFSPEKREMLRNALDEYARSMHADHEKIEARRREMQESIKERFFDADVDFDNNINRQEATDKLPQIARHFKSVDLDSNELISLTELLTAQEKMLSRRQAAKNAIEMRKIINAGESKAQSNQAAFDTDQSAL